jgi:hypothetical protein
MVDWLVEMVDWLEELVEWLAGQNFPGTIAEIHLVNDLLV